MNAEKPQEPEVRRIDRLLAFISLGVVLLSVACFLATIVATALGASLIGGIWPTLFTIQMVGPILALVLIITLLIINLTRKARASRNA